MGNPIDEILGKKDGTADGMVDGFAIDNDDRLNVGYALVCSDKKEVGTNDGAPLGSSVGKTVGPRVGKVLGAID
jgi:hypothetical protein